MLWEKYIKQAATPDERQELWKHWRVSEHFSLIEFVCHCPRCQAVGPSLIEGKIDPILVQSLERLREILGKPITINSGYRCRDHNAEVGGAKQSQHVFGRAADIHVKGVDQKTLAEIAERVEDFEAGGIGTYPRWVHVDVRRTGKARWNG
jgi:hypothetical protein